MRKPQPILAGRSTWERAERIISIAHPGFRDDLTRQTEKMKIWRRSNKIYAPNVQRSIVELGLFKWGHSQYYGLASLAAVYIVYREKKEVTERQHLTQDSNP